MRRLEGTQIEVSDIEFEKPVKLDFEREMLGTYISDHPLRELEGALAAKTDGSCCRSSNEARSWPERGNGDGRRHTREVQIRTTKAASSTPVRSSKTWALDRSQLLGAQF